MTDNLAVAQTNCFFCNKPDQILINTILTTNEAKLVKSANGKIINMAPCNECNDFMSQGIILLIIDEEKCDPSWYKNPYKFVPRQECKSDNNWEFANKSYFNWIPNPYRTGGFFVVKDKVISKMTLCKHTANNVLKHRWTFVDHKVVKQLFRGLIRGLKNAF